MKLAVYFCAIVLVISVGFTGCGFNSSSADAQNNDNETSGELTAELEKASNETSLETVTEEEEYTLNKSESLNDKEITSAGQAYNSISSVYYAVCDSVVEISTETVQTNIFFGQYVSTGAGSGVIIDANGVVVTNQHVIEGASTITVRLIDGTEFDASVIGSDEQADIAVLRIEPGDRELSAAKLGCSSDLKVGEDIVVIGNPLGKLGGTLTTGIISATERNILIEGSEMVLLQTNAAVNPGNSGGGMFNMAGQLVGIVNGKASGTGIEGIGFAIPVDYAHQVIEDLINYGYVRGVVDHGLIMLDVTEQNLPAAYRKYGITQTGTIVIDSKYAADLEYGDSIVAINDIEVDSSADVDLIIKKCSVGDTVKIEFLRDSELFETTFVLREKVPDEISFN